MTLRVADEIFSKFPEVRIGYLFIHDINNTNPKSDALMKKIKDESEKIKNEFNLDTVSQVPFISRWREIYRKFGAKPSDYRSSIENLIRMTLKGRDLDHINTLVDLYNYISLRYKLPVGGEDLDKISGDLELVVSNGSEPEVQLLGDNKPEKPFVGEILYKDDKGVICRCWNWREGERTMLTKETKNAILVIEANDPEEYENLDKALDGLLTLVGHFVGGRVSRGILTKDNASITI
ncbi:hypothetical protein IT418_01520 [bacterium]|nr:hypothetical protein [bacterium]